MDTNRLTAKHTSKNRLTANIHKNKFHGHLKVNRKTYLKNSSLLKMYVLNCNKKTNS